MKTVTLTNENEVVTTTIEPRRINVILDTCGYDESPREWSNLGTLLGFHKDYDFCENEDFKHIKDVERYINKANEFVNDVIANGGYATTVFYYEHGGIRLSTIPFNSQFDSGVIGFYYATKETLTENSLDATKDAEEISKIFENELVIYTKFLNGEIWRIIDNLGELDEGNIYSFDQAMESIGEAGLLEFIDEEYYG